MPLFTNNNKTKYKEDISKENSKENNILKTSFLLKIKLLNSSKRK